MSRDLRIGCAAWSIPRACAAWFPAQGSHLERYAAVLSAVEINSSFYRSHAAATYARWARSVPGGFRFAVKLAREITHVRRLARPATLLRDFLAGATALGRKLGPILVQFPPSLAFEVRRAEAFFRTLRRLHGGAVVCEPRHPSWFEPKVDALLARHRVARVAADPVPVPVAAEPGGWSDLVYFRLHGHPRVYYSAYGEEDLAAMAERLHSLPGRVRAWCVFDNTAVGAATENALRLLELLRGRGRS